MKLKALSRVAAAAALTLASLTVGTGTANASVWWCGDGYCTTAAYDVGVYTRTDHEREYKYTLPAGETFRITCYGNGDGGSIWYTGHRPGWANGWVPGDALTTGHDPNPNIGYCW
ncbi:hypothetical protein ABZ816_13780 [Actinosynnema sp. NPDC047251]|uniref:Putative secreted protein n=1 Tax=Saccharothrix espanaensis (strain ATCC 51144 / DSM 44229 / JCM 9112 / NBRC 15066 / NRRL 15764) TaxID=1179773 RepID=K0KFY7_SACES|nr:hypothetical protein [Saccharothrix espanaensis]CCH35669.1 putative secreted protein [Saccharothrix espanaensis DSM 44229]